MDMIERVARAIALSRVSEFDRAFMEFHGKDLSNFSSWDDCIPVAKLAIEAMRDPTDAMVMASAYKDMTQVSGAIAENYTAMIDEALK